LCGVCGEGEHTPQRERQRATGGGGGGEKRKREEGESTTRATKAGRGFPVGRGATYLKEGGYAERIGSSAPVYLAAVLEYLATEVLRLAGNAARDFESSIINPPHINFAVRFDSDELLRLIGGSVAIAGGKEGTEAPEESGTTEGKGDDGGDDAEGASSSADLLASKRAKLGTSGGVSGHEGTGGDESDEGDEGDEDDEGRSPLVLVWLAGAALPDMGVFTAPLNTIVHSMQRLFGGSGVPERMIIGYLLPIDLSRTHGVDDVAHLRVTCRGGLMVVERSLQSNLLGALEKCDALYGGEDGWLEGGGEYALDDDHLAYKNAQIEKMDFRGEDEEQNDEDREEAEEEEERENEERRRGWEAEAAKEGENDDGDEEEEQDPVGALKGGGDKDKAGGGEEAAEWAMPRLSATGECLGIGVPPPRSPPSTSAKALALIRGFERKQVMVDLAQDLQVVSATGVWVGGLRRYCFAGSGRAMRVTAPLRNWPGVQLGANMQVKAIDWEGSTSEHVGAKGGMKTNVKRRYDGLRFPVGMKNLTLYNFPSLTADIAQLHFPVGMKKLYLYNCQSLTGKSASTAVVSSFFLRLSRACFHIIPHFILHPPSPFLLNHLSILFLAGNIGQLNLPVGMQSVDFTYCTSLTGTAESLRMSESQQIP
jgi:histone H2A